MAMFAPSVVLVTSALEILYSQPAQMVTILSKGLSFAFDVLVACPAVANPRIQWPAILERTAQGAKCHAPLAQLALLVQTRAQTSSYHAVLVPTRRVG